MFSVAGIKTQLMSREIFSVLLVLLVPFVQGYFEKERELRFESFLFENATMKSTMKNWNASKSV